jgi:signal recognition particle GTPase
MTKSVRWKQARGSGICKKGIHEFMKEYQSMAHMINDENAEQHVDSNSTADTWEKYIQYHVGDEFRELGIHVLKLVVSDSASKIPL